MSDMIVVAVTGGRDYKNRAHVWEVLDKILEDHGEIMLLHGAASGADSMAANWAMFRDVPYQAFPADWSTYGRAAGPIRNRSMIGYANLLVAFPGGRGTADCVRAAESAGVPVRVA